MEHMLKLSSRATIGMAFDLLGVKLEVLLRLCKL
jgi:hypothetical protein